MSDPFLDPLDDLWRETEKEIAKKRSSRTVKAFPTDRRSLARPHLPPGYADPGNWTAGRTISLIHRSGDVLTLLGNFREYFYPHLPGARQLRRVDSPLPTEGTEFVEGDWWLHPSVADLARPERWVEEREMVIGATLSECGLHCPEALVCVRLSFGGIARVELIDATQFTCPARNTFLILPKGTDILSALSFDSKVALRAGLEEKEVDAAQQTCPHPDGVDPEDGCVHCGYYAK